MKLTIVSRTHSPEVEELKSLAKKKSVDCECIDVTTLEQKIESDVVYWRSSTLFSKYPSSRTVFLKKLLHESTIVVNKVMSTAPYTIEKSYQQYMALEKKELLHPIPTYAVDSREALMELVSSGTLTYPFIGKPNTGAGGCDVQLITDDEVCKTFTNLNEKIFQNFIENDGDYRVFVIGGVAVAVVKRQATEKSVKWYINNLCKGGRAVRVEKDGEYEALLKIAEDAAMVFSLTVCGVDIIKDKHTGKLHFMEVNTVPQWSCFASALDVSIAEEVLEVMRSLAMQKEQGVLLPDMVRAYYDSRVHFFSVKKQFHYASRMYLWTRNKFYKDILLKIKEVWHEEVAELLEYVSQIRTSTFDGTKTNAGRKYRKESYKKHFKILKYNRVFFKLRFMKTLYNEETYTKVLASIDKTDIAEVWNVLVTNPKDILVLSTQAINFMYNVAHFFGDTYRMSPEMVKGWASQEVVLEREQELEARLYLLTHAIIGKSEFYAKEIAEKNREAYTELALEAEKIIKESMILVSLDIKFEFLVCCKLVGYVSELEKSIWAEAHDSSSPHGNYYVDTYNRKKNRQRLDSLSMSEHRNVLAIMASINR